MRELRVSAKTLEQIPDSSLRLGFDHHLAATYRKKPSEITRVYGQISNIAVRSLDIISGGCEQERLIADRSGLLRGG